MKLYANVFQVFKQVRNSCIEYEIDIYIFTIGYIKLARICQ